MKLLYSKWMRELDELAIKKIGIPSLVLMENASREAARFFNREFPLKNFAKAIIVAGKGNNGGDGLATGRLLFQAGYQVHCFLLADPRHMSPDTATQLRIGKNIGLPITAINQAGVFKRKLIQAGRENIFLVDAIFGTGLKEPIRKGSYAEMIEIINQSGIPIASMDIPSGLSEEFLPSEGIHVEADVTITFQCLKIAHLHPDGNKHCGRIQVADIGIPRTLAADKKYFIDIVHPAIFSRLFSPREVDAHKGDFGHCLNISGSLEKPGAGVLSSFAVIKAGAGLCTAAVIPKNRLLPVMAHPELMTLVYRKSADILPRIPEFDCLLMGPGLGAGKAIQVLIKEILAAARIPVILDADALNGLAGRLNWLNSSAHSPRILTPHPGEFSRMLQIPVSELQKDRITLAREFARQYQVYLVLKGHHSLIALPDGQVFINMTGNPGMATAGSGDVLSGMIAGLVCQFYDKYSLAEILTAAVFIHGYAGDLAVKRTGEISLTASDVLAAVPEAIRKLDEYTLPFSFA